MKNLTTETSGPTKVVSAPTAAAQGAVASRARCRCSACRISSSIRAIWRVQSYWRATATRCSVPGRRQARTQRRTHAQDGEVVLGDEGHPGLLAAALGVAPHRQRRRGVRPPGHGAEGAGQPEVLAELVLAEGPVLLEPGDVAELAVRLAPGRLGGQAAGISRATERSMWSAISSCISRSSRRWSTMERSRRRARSSMLLTSWRRAGTRQDDGWWRAAAPCSWAGRMGRLHRTVMRCAAGPGLRPKRPFSAVLVQDGPW